MAQLKTLTINDTGFIKLPSGTTAQRPSVPTTGMMRFNTDLSCNEYYDGTNWIDPVTGGAPVVTNGLVLNLDAGISRSYPGSGILWRDLSGYGNNGTLTNGPTYSSANGGSIVFDGSNDYAQCSPSLTLTSATFLVWMRRNGTPNATAGILFSRTSGGEGINYNGLNVGYHWNGAVDTYSWNSGLTIPDLSWVMVSIVVTPTSATAYLGQSTGLTSSVNSVSHSATTINAIRVASDPAFSARSFTGNISQSLIYNRALTATEVTNNYNSLKGRFGL